MNAVGVAQVSDPHTRRTLGEAAADLRGARAQLLYDVGELYERLAAGHEVTMADRVAMRRDQVRVAWRAVEAADRAFTCCGGNAVRLDKPVQRFWRAMHAGHEPRGVRPRSRVRRRRRDAHGRGPVGPGGRHVLIGAGRGLDDHRRSPPTATSRTLATPDGDLHYHEAGDGPPLLLLHGSGPGVSGWANFGGNLPLFAEHFRTLVLDLPGFGTSHAVDGQPGPARAGRGARVPRRARHRPARDGGQLPRRWSGGPASRRRTPSG